jgi:hypothetical protein
MRAPAYLGKVDLGETGHLLAGNRPVSPRSTSGGAPTAGLTRMRGSTLILRSRGGAGRTSINVPNCRRVLVRCPER